MLGKTKKLGVIIILAIILLMPIFFLLPSSSLTNAAEVNSYCFTRDYLSKSNGKVEYGMTLQFSTENMSLTDQGKFALKNALTEFITTLRQEEINELNFDSEDEVKIKDISSDNGRYCYSIEYPSFEVFNKYHKLIDKTSDNSTFIFKSIQKIKSPFSEETKLSLQTRLSDVLSNFSSDSILFKPSYLFSYTTFNPYAKSNAHRVVETELGTSHIWETQQGEVMQIKLTRPQAGWWYLLAILIPLTLAIISISLISIYNILKKKKKRI